MTSAKIKETFQDDNNNDISLCRAIRSQDEKNEQ